MTANLLGPQNTASYLIVLQIGNLLLIALRTILPASYVKDFARLVALVCIKFAAQMFLKQLRAVVPLLLCLAALFAFYESYAPCCISRHETCNSNVSKLFHVGISLMWPFIALFAFYCINTRARL